MRVRAWQAYCFFFGISQVSFYIYIYIKFIGIYLTILFILEMCVLGACLWGMCVSICVYEIEFNSLFMSNTFWKHILSSLWMIKHDKKQSTKSIISGGTGLLYNQTCINITHNALFEEVTMWCVLSHLQ